MLFNVFFSSIARLRRCKRPCWFLHCQKGTILIFMGYEQCEIKIIANLTTQSWLITINMYQEAIARISMEVGKLKQVNLKIICFWKSQSPATEMKQEKKKRLKNRSKKHMNVIQQTKTMSKRLCNTSKKRMELSNRPMWHYILSFSFGF
ncbi:uncharacterized protein LOC108204039 isoform X3 [Daucus carota subsp. sativus]